MNIERINHVLTKAIAGIAENDLQMMQEAKKPTAQIRKTVELARLYHGSMNASIKTQQRLYKRLMTAVNKIAEKRNMDPTDVFDQITAEAQKHGKIQVQPGKHY